MTVSAPVRFKPRPPTCVVNRRTSIVGLLLKLVTKITKKLMNDTLIDEYRPENLILPGRDREFGE